VLCTALAATVGTGNIAGVAAAIAIGGAGAVFWMWVAAFFGMMTNYAENVLGIYFRRRNSEGEWSGGAMYYLQDGVGGYSYKEENHVANERDTYGYRFFKEREAFEEALVKLYTEEIIPLVAHGLCAAVYTQVSDVEDETNGLLSYDRQVLKVTPETMLALAEQLKLG
jgi:Na+/alanine symporter